MADDTVILPAEPWYTSKVYIGAVTTIASVLASLAPKVFAALGLTSPDAVNVAVTSVFQVFALLAATYTATARAKSSVAPLTLTKVGADNHPNTLASR